MLAHVVKTPAWGLHTKTCNIFGELFGALLPHLTKFLPHSGFASQVWDQFESLTFHFQILIICFLLLFELFN